MRKFFISKNQIENDKIIITGSDVNHIKNVLRLNINDKLDLCDNGSYVNYISEIVKLDADKVECRIIEKIDSREHGNESHVVLDVYQGIPKFDKMEYIIQKGTELGVHDFIPVKMRRTVVKLNEKDSQKKVERWNRIAEVASKQSMRDYIPVVHNPIDIDELIKKFDEYDLVILAYEEEKDNYIKDELKTFKTRIDDVNFKIAIIIGPEGGIDKEEAHKFIDSGAHVVSLGKRILRTETASMQMAAVIMYELDY